jgi:hypothetical protein
MPCCSTNVALVWKHVPGLAAIVEPHLFEYPRVDHFSQGAASVQPPVLRSHNTLMLLAGSKLSTFVSVAECLDERKRYTPCEEAIPIYNLPVSHGLVPPTARRPLSAIHLIRKAHFQNNCSRRSNKVSRSASPPWAMPFKPTLLSPTRDASMPASQPPPPPSPQRQPR